VKSLVSFVCFVSFAGTAGCERSASERSSVATSAASAAGVKAFTPAPSAAVPAPSVSAPLSPLAVKALPLIARFATSLQDALGSAMSQGGPVAAIDVCSSKAPEISREVSSSDLTIRRIGTRVRNPENRPTDAELAVLQRLSTEQPTYEAEGNFYKAIFVQPLCLACHGAKDALPPAVLAALAKKYPSDEAVGYAVGDLRGAFVVEPKVN